jgi:hypothetical protein
MEEFNLNKSSNNQSFVTLVSKAITKIEDKDNLAHQSDGNPETLDSFNTLVSGISKWHPLFLPIYLGNTKLFDRIKEMTKSNHFDYDISPLNLAIAFPNKTEIVRHILEKCNTDPAIRDGLGKNALEMAAMHSDNTELLDLILKHENVKIDGRDESGRTALHLAAASSNVVAARHLIRRGAKPNLLDSHGLSPLHVAALCAEDINLVDVFLKNKQVDVNSLDKKGQNALCYAECNQHGLTKDIVNRLKEYGLITESRDSNNSSVLDLVTQCCNKDKRLSLLPVRRESDGSERKKQFDYSLYTTPQPKGSPSKSSSKRISYIILILSSFLVIFFLQTIFDMKRPVNDATTTFLLLLSNRQPKCYP